MIMWTILEHPRLEKVFASLPPQVLKKYELWQNIIATHGPEKLREFPGFGDEKLKGGRSNQRSSRLSLQYRVVYCVHREAVTVYVIELTPHDY